ncbi:MAG: hypothetical protein QM570_07455 [Planctomycetota bacterium]|jgi:hypothetical protein|nr:hypothetical protein [Planctomycetota bacterium]
MSRNYSPKTFLRKTPNALLKEYFAAKGVLGEIAFEKLGETKVDPVIAAMEALPVRERTLIEQEFRQINELAYEQGVRVLLEEGQSPYHELDLAETFGSMGSHYERAFWMFLNHRKVFDIAADFAYMDRVRSWRNREVGAGLTPAVEKNDLLALAHEVSAFYRQEGRGYHCVVDNYLREDPERHCYFAYPEDYGTVDMELNEQEEFIKRARKPAFEVVFVYRPQTGILETNAKGRKDQIEKLLGIFCRVILGLDGLPDKPSERYDLAPLKDPSISLATDPEDGIEGVFIRMLRFDLPDSGNRRITFEANSATDGKAIYRLIERVIAKQGLPMNIVTVAKAKLKLEFAGVDGKKGKTLTFEISTPDRCTLKDDPPDQIARKYIERWGFVVD